MQSYKIEGFDEIQDMLKEYRQGGALELKKYREIGTIEECKRAMEDYRRKGADKASESGRKEI